MEIMREWHVKETDEEVQAIVYDDIGKEWIQHFLRWHPELVNVHSWSIDMIRVKDTSSEWLQWWFDDLKKMWMEFNIKSENVYNMDESGFAIDEKETERYIININIYQ